MNILIAPDSFKGSLTALEICNLFLSEIKGLAIDALALADGGEGSLQAISAVGDFNKIRLKVSAPLFTNIEASYLFDKNTQTAYIELAAASGLTLLDKPDVMNASTYGTGQLIADALQRGAKNIILFAGGSATNDAGTGIAAALGICFYDRQGELVPPVAKNLTRILKIDRSRSLIEKYGAKLSVAVDVDNPFYGKNGAAYTYAAQKGASNSQILFLDTALKHIAGIFYWKYQIDVQQIKGSGAAGGLAGGLAAMLNADIVPASDLIFQLTRLEEKIKNADIVVSGEGKIDKQTLNGKLLAKVSALVQKHNKKLWAICGYFDGNNELKQKLNIDKVFALAKNKEEIPEALSAAKEKMKNTINEIIIEFMKL